MSPPLCVRKETVESCAPFLLDRTFTILTEVKLCFVVVSIVCKSQGCVPHLYVISL